MPVAANRIRRVVDPVTHEERWRCARCRQMLPRGAFYFSKKGGVSIYCRPCRSEYQKSGRLHIDRQRQSDEAYMELLTHVRAFSVAHDRTFAAVMTEALTAYLIARQWDMKSDPAEIALTAPGAQASRPMWPFDDADDGDDERGIKATKIPSVDLGTPSTEATR